MENNLAPSNMQQVQLNKAQVQELNKLENVDVYEWKYRTIKKLRSTLVRRRIDFIRERVAETATENPNWSDDDIKKHLISSIPLLHDFSKTHVNLFKIVAQKNPNRDAMKAIDCMLLCREKVEKNPDNEKEYTMKMKSDLLGQMVATKKKESQNEI